MKVVVKTVSVTYGRKFNLDEGDGGFSKYESMELSSTVWGQIEAEKDEPVTVRGVDAAMEELFAIAKNAVKAQAVPVLSKRNETRARIAAELAASVEAAKAFRK